MRIDLLANDGSPIGVIPQDIYERGVGGAELAMLTLMQVLASRGHDVTVYNNPRIPGDHGGVHFARLADFDMGRPRDVIVVFRSPNDRVDFTRLRPARCIWWSTDQYTVGDFRAFGPKVDLVVTISPHHAMYMERTYAIASSRMLSIDLGVNLVEYDEEVVEKVAGRCIFCSVPDRGLMILHAAWPLIKRQAPNASLTITSDYTLWGNAEPGNHLHRLHWAGMPDVDFLGNVRRRELVRFQRQAEIMAYPCTYDELFCIAAAECQVAGALPVYHPAGALPTTAEYGIAIPGIVTTPDFVDRFADRIGSLLTGERSYLGTRQAAMVEAARRRFDWNNIAAVWESVLEKGEQPYVKPSPYRAPEAGL